RHQNRSVGHGLTRNASRKTYVLSPSRMRLEVALALEPSSLPRPEISRCPLVIIPLPLASKARMASSTFEAAAGLAAATVAGAGLTCHSRPPAGVSMPRAVGALAILPNDMQPPLRAASI